MKNRLMNTVRDATAFYVELRHRHPDWPEDHIRYISLLLATPELAAIAKWLPCETVFQNHETRWDDLCILHASMAMAILAFPDNPSAAIDLTADMDTNLIEQIQQILDAPETARRQCGKRLDTLSEQDLLGIAENYTIYRDILISKRPEEPREA